VAVSDRGIVMKPVLALCCLCLTACPSQAPAPIYTPVPSAIPCALAAKINAARLIRDPDSGYAEFLVCDAGAE
jgi:hypothetical protein